ncbi:hypothetical protein TKK_0014422 [Trichogramma kaykai]
MGVVYSRVRYDCRIGGLINTIIKAFNWLRFLDVDSSEFHEPVGSNSNSYSGNDYQSTVQENFYKPQPILPMNNLTNENQASNYFQESYVIPLPSASAQRVDFHNISEEWSSWQSSTVPEYHDLSFTNSLGDNSNQSIVNTGQKNQDLSFTYNLGDNTDQAKNTPDADLTPPAWFVKFFVKFEDNMNASLDRLITHVAMINERLDKVAQTQLEQGAAILQNSRTVAQLDKRVSGELNELRQRQNESSEMLSELQKRMTVFTSTVRDADVPPTCSTPTVDSCEVRVTGIPASVSTPDITTAESILKALQLERLNPHVISVRPWTAGRAEPSKTSSNSANA